MSKQTLKTWKTLQFDDRISIVGENGTFTFVDAVIETDTDETLWVTVHGGKRGREKTRFFTPDKIVIPDEKTLQKQRKKKENTDA